MKGHRERKRERWRDREMKRHDMKRQRDEETER